MDPLRLGICCSLRNSPLASNLNTRLTRNLGLEQAVIIADDEAPVSETWEQASACSAVLILLDATTARGPVRREAWQSLLEHNGEPPVAVVRLEACQYPKLLERSNSKFHAMNHPLEMARWVERWVSALLPAAAATTGALPISGLPADCPVEWWTQVVDQPGVIDAPDLDSAQAFAHQAAAHFDGVCWIGCEDSPPDALTAEIEQRGGGGRRLLFVLAGAEREVAGALKQSAHSFVIVPPAGAWVDEVPVDEHPAVAWLGACPKSGFPQFLLERMAGGDLGDWHPLVIPLTKDGSWIRPAQRFESSDETRARCVEVLKEIFGFNRPTPLTMDRR